jgi:hypothetical protein
VGDGQTVHMLMYLAPKQELVRGLDSLILYSFFFAFSGPVEHGEDEQMGWNGWGRQEDDQHRGLHGSRRDGNVSSRPNACLKGAGILWKKGHK